MMICQIEITTYCNAKCFYCPNEFLEHRHISFTLFTEIIDSLPTQSDLLLQGTGEPLLHPQFWEMVAYARLRGHKVGIITNGTVLIEDEQLGQIDTIGISIDTLCTETAKRSGRPDPIPIVNALTHYHKVTSGKIRIYAVDYGQDIYPLKSFVESLGIRLTVQQIQRKTSYQRHYTTPQLPYKHLQCRYIDNEIHRYFFVNGKQVPCCYMIDVDSALSTEEVADSFHHGIVPQCCSQCGELVGTPRLSSRSDIKAMV